MCLLNEIKRRKLEIKNAKIVIEKNKTLEIEQAKKNGNIPITQFIRTMRLENENRRSSEYSCSHCDYKTKEKSSLKTHNETVHEKIGYSCNQCEYKTKEKRHLKTHNEIVHENFGYSCNQCDFKSKVENHLKSHIDSVHENNTNEGDELQISTQETIEDSRTRRKLATLGKDATLKCSICEWSTKSKTLLNRHIVRYHEDIHRTVKNPTMATSTKTPEKEKETQIEDILPKNKKIPTKETGKKYVSKRIKCEKCDKKFNKISTFNRHMEEDHKGVVTLSNKVTLPVKTRPLRNINNRDNI